METSMLKFIILFTGCLLLTTHVVGQTEKNPPQSLKTSPKSFFSHEDLALKIDYFGELGLHPGLAVGLEYPLHKNSWFLLHWDNEVGGYYHKWNHTGVFARTSVGTRFTAPFGLYFDLQLGAGYLHTFVAGDTYVRTEKEELTQKSDGGDPHFMPSLVLLLGWDIAKNRDLPLALHFGVDAYGQTPFNHSVLPHIAIRTGITYKINQYKK